MMEGENSSDSKRVKPPELDMYLNADNVNPMFDPSRVLLRRVFFLDPKKLNTSLWDFTHLEIISPSRDRES